MLEPGIQYWMVLIAAVFAVAFFYSSVGRGGVTGHLAALAPLGVAPAVVGALLGTHFGVRRWNCVIFSRLRAGVRIFSG